MFYLKPTSSNIFSIWVWYTFFVIYGSLVPLDFNPMPIDLAWVKFQHIPMFKLGVESRADWIANGVLYVPVGFLTAHLLSQIFPATSRIHLLVLAGIFSFLLALCIEFSQLFFPPRTVSLNDLLAEVIGSVVGLVLANRYSNWFTAFLIAAFGNSRRLFLRLGEAYLVGYLAFCLFPFDILLSSAELEQKLGGDNWGWLLAGNQQGPLLVALKALAEIVLTLPFGIVLAYCTAVRPVNFNQVFLYGLLLGGFVEFSQLFTASGVSQGLSVATRVIGVWGGFSLWRHRVQWSSRHLANLIGSYRAPLGVLYVLALLIVNGWLTYRWIGIEDAVAKLSELHFLPFYYHYYTTEAKALFSLASICFMYLPIGVYIWARGGVAFHAFLTALVVSSLLEIGKLFLNGVHPDPTNILLGGIASWSMFLFVSEMAKVVVMPEMVEPQLPKNEPNQRRFKSSQEAIGEDIAGRRLKRYALMVPIIIFSFYWAASFPSHGFILCSILLVFGIIIWNRPVMLASIIPAAMPILDFSPWSGRFYLDEYDLFLLIGLSLGYARTPHARRSGTTDFLLLTVAGLVGFSFFVSAVRGLVPWQSIDANAFTSYFSQFNAIRIIKGALWGVISINLLYRFVAAGFDIRRPFAVGIVSGLLMTVIVVVWERVTFSSIFDFTSDYRVTGPFSSMHIGGAYIECFISIATPFLIVLLLQTKNWVNRWLGIILLLGTTYVLMVTFSRNGYLAFGIAVAVSLFFGLCGSSECLKRRNMAAALSVGIFVVATPIFTGQFAQERIANTENDFSVRKAHWEDALDIRTPGWETGIFGMGLGRYPESHYLFSREPHHAGTYQLKNESEHSFVRLGAGDPIYLEQIVSIEPHQKYVLRLKVRSKKARGTTIASLCEKWLITSFKCVSMPIFSGSEAGTWRTLEFKFETASLGDNPWYAERSIKFALHNPSDKNHIDITDIRLEGPLGRNLLNNGDFSKDLDHWFFSADSHLQWHTKSLPIAVLFDQGWFGLIVVGLLSILALKRATERAWNGDLQSAAALAALIGFLVVGLFDTLIDAPRFLFIFCLLGWFCSSQNFGDCNYGKKLGNQCR